MVVIDKVKVKRQEFILNVKADQWTRAGHETGN